MVLCFEKKLIGWVYVMEETNRMDLCFGGDIIG